MNKGELVEKVAQSSGLSRADTQEMLGALLGTIERELKSGGEVRVTGFGKFYARERSARQGVNPRTGQRTTIPASKVPSFSAGNTFKKSL
jgi:DNA-binding protein HU-beta